MYKPLWVEIRQYSSSKLVVIGLRGTAMYEVEAGSLVFCLISFGFGVFVRVSYLMLSEVLLDRVPSQP